MKKLKKNNMIKKEKKDIKKFKMKLMKKKEN